MQSVESLLAIVVSNTYETDVLRHRLALWRSLLEKRLFSGEASTEDPKTLLATVLARSAEEQMELPEHVEAIEQWMHASQLLTRDNVYDLFDELEKKIKELPVLTLSLAVDLPRKEREELGRWAREQIHPNALLNLRRDAAIMGGAVIVWKNKEFDRSLRSRLQQQRSVIREAFSEVIRSSANRHER